MSAVSYEDLARFSREVALADYADKMQVENRKIRNFATVAWELLKRNEPRFVWEGLREQARELGIEDSDD